MPVVTLHPKTLATLEAVGGRLSEYRDTVVRGLVLRVTPRGVRSFGVVYWRAGRNRRMTLGRVGRLDLARARELARDAFVELAAGKDPGDERRRSRLAGSTLPQTVEQLVARCLPRLDLRPSTRREWTRIAEVDICPALGKRPAAELSRGEVRAWSEAIKRRSKHTANAAMKVLHRVYSWGLRQDLIATSPCAGLGRPAPEVRNSRWLRPHELRALWQALGTVARASPYPDVMRLLLLTALRRGEVLGARREEFQDLDVPKRARWIVPAERMKGGLEHVVPLSRQSARVVRRRLDAVTGACLFPLPGEDRPARWTSRYAAMLQAELLRLVREDLGDAAAAVERWTVHSIRHTVATHMQDTLKVPDAVVALILAHRPPGLSDVDGIYLRGRRLDERREALQHWADWLERTTRRQRVLGGAAEVRSDGRMKGGTQVA